MIRGFHQTTPPQSGSERNSSSSHFSRMAGIGTPSERRTSNSSNPYSKSESSYAYSNFMPNAQQRDGNLRSMNTIEDALQEGDLDDLQMTDPERTASASASEPRTSVSRGSDGRKYARKSSGSDLPPVEEEDDSGYDSYELSKRSKVSNFNTI